MARWLQFDEVAEALSHIRERCNILPPTTRNELHDEEVLAGESRKCLSLEKRLDPLVAGFNAMLDYHLVLLLIPSFLGHDEPPDANFAP